MKIVSDNNTFIIPLINKKTILVFKEYKREIIDCLSTYFLSNKKTKCIVYDDDGIKISTNEINLIYLPDDLSLNNNLSLNLKTIMNQEISEIINENPEKFLSIDRIRKELSELITDEGIIKLNKIMENGISEPLQVVFKGLNINTMLQMFEIENELLTESQKQIIIINLLLYVHRNEINIVLLDKNIDYNTVNWINSNKENTYFVIDNESLTNYYEGFDIVVLSNQDHMICYEDTDDRIQVISYMNHNLIKTNMSLQKDKNVEIFDQYNDQTSTIFIQNSSNDILESL